MNPVDLVVWASRLVVLAGFVLFLVRVALSWRDTEGAGSGGRRENPRGQGASHQ